MTTRIGDADCAINTNLVRYCFKADPATAVPDKVRLLVQSKSKPRDDAKKLPARLKSGNVKIPAVGPSEAELDFNAGDTELVLLWVGMRPDGAEKYTRNAKTHCPGQSVHSSRESAVTQIAYQDNALRVVAACSDYAHANFFALIDPNAEGICHAIECVKEDVFYFPAYRNDTEKAIEKRYQSWNSLVVRSLTQASEPKPQWSKTYDKNKFTIPLPDARMNDIAANIHTYLISKRNDTAYLKRALALLSEQGEEAAEGNEMILLLATDPSSIEEGDCEQLKKELEHTYPGIEKLIATEGELFTLCQSCATADISIPFSHIRAFVVAFVLQSRMKIYDDSDTMARHVMDMLKLQTGGEAFPAQTFEAESAQRLLKIVIASLDDLLQHSKAQTEAVAESQGGQVVADALPKIFEKYGNTFDVDQTKLYAAHVVRFVAWKVLPELKGDLEKGLADRIRVLKELEKNIM